MKFNKADYHLVPNVSLGKFRFDTPIQNHLSNLNYTFFPKPENDNIMEDIYSFEEPFLDIFVDSKGYITSVNCERFCFYKDQNLIKQDVREIMSLFKIEATLIEKLWNNLDGKERRYTVYDFDELGLQVWAYRHKIVLITCSNLNDVPNESNPNPNPQYPSQ